MRLFKALLLFSLFIRLFIYNLSICEAELVLVYDKPAEDWQSQALPIGNGRMGAMLFGSLPRDRIQFNEISLWTGNEDVMGAYQAFGNLYINLAGHNFSDVTDYKRELDLGRGISRLSYKKDSVSYSREYFASHPDQVIVMHMSADKPASCTGSVGLEDMHNAATAVSGNKMTSPGTLTTQMTQRGRRGGQSSQNDQSDKTMYYESQVIVLNEGGQVGIQDNNITFSQCDTVTILLGTGTSYIMDYQKKFQSEHPHEKLTAQMDSASSKSYLELKDTHIKDYLSLFNRVELNLGKTSSELSKLTTDKRLEAYKNNSNDPELEALLFQYGRYLLMSCSRDSLPANLQGLWNDRNDPPWNSDYHTNINVEMNYWPAEPANLSECHLRLFEMVTALREPYKKASAAQFPPSEGESMRGWTVRTESNPFGNMSYVWNMGGSAWYAQHFWEHYAFTLDKEFLIKTAYPMMKETCEFWEDHLKILDDGRLAVPNGWSPEHGPKNVDGVTYDQMMVWDLFSNYIKASDILGIDKEYREKVISMREKLVGPKVGKWGQLQEWMDDIDDPKDQHRHTSHLFGVYPGKQISLPRTPELAKAAEVSLAARGETGDSRRSWTWPWRCALWARLENAEKAYNMVQGLLKYNILPNLLGNHPPMQMDGNFGITAAVCEMLIQSHAGEIQLLPALPEEWKSGSVKGLCARGGFEVDIQWEDGKLKNAVLRSNNGQECKIRYQQKVVDIKCSSGQSRIFDAALNQTN
ncbi:MAG: glycoside hydrolase family 95 protein [Sedimentisphaerales bacterium]|nr:glycoside hydrolase family 95 protein [Sedimentisphaerales bacterium]